MIQSREQVLVALAQESLRAAEFASDLQWESARYVEAGDVLWQQYQELTKEVPDESP